MQNIHRIADIVSGAIIGPDETFSVNDYVGPRTAANGFVPAPIIGENGYFTDELGGGVSQFATTLFNAAFFAGLEITEYQPHGIYISRYPYGREATLDYGNIDLEIHNNTPYGVLIWPTYGESSITVTLYSTHSIDAEQSDQTSEPYSAVCTRVTTTRKRTYMDSGKVELIVWSILRELGREGVRARIRRDNDFARRLAERARSHPQLELVTEPVLSICCFRYTAPGIEDLNAFNTALLRRLLRETQHLPSSTVVDGTYVIRPCFINARTTEEYVDGLADAVIRLGDEMLASV